MENKRAVIINNTFMRRQLFNFFYKGRDESSLDDFWWLFFRKYPEIKLASVQVTGSFPVFTYLVVDETE